MAVVISPVWLAVEYKWPGSAGRGLPAEAQADNSEAVDLIKAAGSVARVSG